jgi:hypothetical protein
MQWVKLGLIVEPRGQADWIGSHAALPVLHAAGGSDRVYFSSRDGRNRSHIGYVTLSLQRPAAAHVFSPAPVLGPGRLGAFDDAGVTSACLVADGERLFLFYTGWALGVSVPFYLHAGLAVSLDGGERFERASEGPLLDRSRVDPYLTASPWVLIDGGIWRMWYVSGTGWQAQADGPRHRYHIKYAESRDGLHWERRGVVCIDYGAPAEHAFGRPCVVKDGDLYRMWYSYRGARYRMGYAESHDGLRWSRRDDRCVLDVSPEGWDSDMVTYPMVVNRGGTWQMLYNGNGYGRTGIGLARHQA